MQFINKTEWYIVILAAFTLSLIYYVAFDKNAQTLTASATGILGKAIGQNAAGNFQKPF